MLSYSAALLMEQLRLIMRSRKSSLIWLVIFVYFLKTRSAAESLTTVDSELLEVTLQISLVGVGCSASIPRSLNDV